MFNSHTDQQKKKAFSETLHSFGLKTTKESLNKTIFLLNFGSLKSHQTVFDEAFGEITEAKRSKLASDNGLPERAYECGNDGNDRQNNVQAGEKKS